MSFWAGLIAYIIILFYTATLKTFSISLKASLEQVLNQTILCHNRTSVIPAIRVYDQFE